MSHDLTDSLAVAILVLFRIISANLEPNKERFLCWTMGLTSPQRKVPEGQDPLQGNPTI